MKKLFTILTVLCCFTIASQAQSKSGSYGLQVEAGHTFELKFNDNRKAYHEGWNIALSPGYHVTDKLFVGAGVALYDYRYSVKDVPMYGSDKLIDIKNSFLSVPIYAHGLWKFRDGGKPGLFISLKAGYGIISKSVDQIEGQAEVGILGQDYSGGLYVSPSVGFMYPLNNKHALSLSVSYDYQDYSVTSKTEGGDYKSDEPNITIGVKLGWAF